MKAIQALRIVGIQVAVTVVLTWTSVVLAKTLSPLFVPCLAIFSIYTFYSFRTDVPDKEYSKSEPSKSLGLEDELAQIKTELSNVEQLLQDYGSLIEASGTICGTNFTKLYKEQKGQLKKYNDFRKQYAEQFGSIVNVLEGHGKDIAYNARFATEQNTSFCKIIGKYRQIAENNQRIVKERIDSVEGTLDCQHKAITLNRKLVDEHDASIQNTLQSQAQLIGNSKKLIQEHGTSIENIVSHHSNLVAEYQKALDGLALLITANRVFTLMHKTSDWKSLGGHAQRVDARVAVHYTTYTGPNSVMGM